MSIPRPLIEVVEAARAVVRDVRALNEARRMEASERVRAEKMKALNRSLVALDKTVVALEKLAAKRPQSTLDWTGVFKVAGKVLDLATKAKSGRLTKEDALNAADIIEGEIVGEPETKKR